MKTLFRKSEGKGALGRIKHRWEDTMKCVQYDILNLIHLDEIRVLLKMVTNLRGHLLTTLATISFSIGKLLHAVILFVKIVPPLLFRHSSTALPCMPRYDCSDICRAATLCILILTRMNQHRTFISPVAARGARVVNASGRLMLFIAYCCQVKCNAQFMQSIYS